MSIGDKSRELLKAAQACDPIPDVWGCPHHPHLRGDVFRKIPLVTTAHDALGNSLSEDGIIKRRIRNGGEL